MSTNYFAANGLLNNFFPSVIVYMYLRRGKLGMQ
jgi:hypothetical protein